MGGVNHFLAGNADLAGFDELLDLRPRHVQTGPQECGYSLVGIAKANDKGLFGHRAADTRFKSVFLIVRTTLNSSMFGLVLGLW
jgi:hypothetical protein